MENTVRIHKNNVVLEKKAEAGTNLFKFLRDNSIDLKPPCGGKGTCGKCRIKADGLTGNISESERKLLGEKAIEKGYRLACYNKIKSDIDIYLDEDNGGAKIATGGKDRKIKLEPVVIKKFVELDKPSINDQRSDAERVLSCCEEKVRIYSSELLSELPGIIRKNDFRVTLCIKGKELISVEPGDTTNKLFGIAVDIGTTTIAAYLIDMLTGKRADVYSSLNPQKKFGADVISRIEYTMGREGSLDEMNKTIIQCINEIVETFVEKNNLKNDDIYAAVFVGNTTMMHFLAKLPADNIAVSPFIPAATQAMDIPAGKLGIGINPNGYAVLFPSVSAYIGADTIAAVLSSGMYGREKTSLLIDLGTNGEIVLGNRKWLYACSTAAGPAFEGANIRNGIGGVSGAIDKVIINSKLEYTTIDGRKPIGICGSGIVDAIAAMLSNGVIDETGRIADSDESENIKNAELRNRLVDADGMNSFLLVGSEESAVDNDIAITQKDVRELQNAKAAIAAGVKILARHAGIDVGDIDDVYLAGGFGSYINVDSALKIGLIPAELRGKIQSIGNAAGTGAVEGLSSRKMLKKANEIKGRIEYIELSAYRGFSDEYIECMMFEE